MHPRGDQCCTLCNGVDTPLDSPASPPPEAMPRIGVRHGCSVPLSSVEQWADSTAQMACTVLFKRLCDH